MGWFVSFLQACVRAAHTLEGRCLLRVILENDSEFICAVQWRFNLALHNCPLQAWNNGANKCGQSVQPRIWISISFPGRP